MDRREFDASGNRSRDSGGWTAPVDRRSQQDYDKRAFANMSSSERIVEEHRGIAATGRLGRATPGQRTTIGPLYACLITDARSDEISTVFERFNYELGSAGGDFLHYRNIGDPRVIDDVYADTLDKAAAELIREEAAFYEERVKDSGGEHHYMLREMRRLAKWLRVESAPKPVFVVYMSGEIRNLAAVSICDSILHEKSLQDAAIHLLCTRLGEATLREQAAAGRTALKEYLVRALAPLSDARVLGPWTYRDLTVEQADAYAEHGYLTHHKLHLTGERGGRDQNIVEIDDKAQLLSPQQFELLMLLVERLTNQDSGWVCNEELRKEIKSSLPQAIKRLRHSLGKVISDPHHLIESNSAGRYRISMHPDFITYDFERLSEHSSAVVTRLADELPPDGPPRISII